MALGSIVIDLLLKTGAFNNDAKVAERRMQQMGKQAREAGRVIGTALAGALTVAGAAALSLTRATIETAEQVDRLAKLSGTTSQTFQRWAVGAQTVGIEQDKLSDIFKDMQDRVGDFIQTGGGPMADFFERIAPKVGVTAEQFARLSGPQALQLFVDSLEKAGANANEMVFYMEAIASDSTMLLPLLQNNGRAMQELGDQAERYGAILDKDAISASRAMRRQTDELTLAMTGLRNRVGVELMPDLVRLTRQFTEATTQGDKLAETAQRIADGIRTLATGVGFVARAFVTVGESIGAAMAIADGFRTTLQGILGMDWGKIREGLNLQLMGAQGVGEAWGVGGSSGPPPVLMHGRDNAPSGMFMRSESEVQLERLMDAQRQAAGVGQKLADTAKANSKVRSDAEREAADAMRESERALEEYMQAQIAFEERQLAWMTRIEDATALMEGPASQAVLTLKRSIAEADAALAAGTITIAQHSDYVAAMGHQYGETLTQVDVATGEMSTIADQAARNMQDAFADFLFDPFQDGLSGMVESFAETLRRLAAQAAASKIFEAIGTWAGSYTGAGSGWVNAVGSILDGRRATGGPVYPGGTFLVGENGPEVLRMGNNSGTIVPNNRLASLGGGAAPQVEINIQNNSSAQVERPEVSVDGMGKVIVNMVVQEVARNISGGGVVGQSIQSAYGVRRQGYANG